MTRTRPPGRAGLGLTGLCLTGLCLTGLAVGLLTTACGAAPSPAPGPGAAQAAGPGASVTTVRGAGPVSGSSARPDSPAAQPDSPSPAATTAGPSALRPARPVVPPPRPTGALAPGLPETGLYVDGPDGEPHYVISVRQAGRSTIAGSVSFIYQDARTGLLSAYTAGRPQAGAMTLLLKTGPAVRATVRPHGFTIAGCARYLPFIDSPAGCTFTYHGDRP